MTKKIFRCCVVVVFVGMLTCPKKLSGQETNPVLRLAPVVVIGTKDSEKSLSGSGTYLETPQLRAFDLGDAHEILRQVPGVYVREEEGYGLRQNVSLRGVDITRSSKVTLMEDGVLTAPSPYSSPQTYYTPNVLRMSGVEILKGSSQVRFGPHTTGGVINYLSTPIPQRNEGFVRLLYGTDNEVRAHTWYGGWLKTDAGRFGYLGEFYVRRADGFKQIDLTPDFRDGNKTGFTLWEPMLKLAWELPTQKRQSLEFKLAYSDLEDDETYLGITDADFRANPIRRYSSTRFDEIVGHNWRTYLRHTIELTDDLQLVTTGYYQDFHRNWYKLDSLRNIQGGPVSMSLAEALATPGAPLETLRGANGGILRVRANNRDHWLAGVESVAEWRFQTGDLPHEAVAGFRYHSDLARRLDWRDDYYQTSSGTITNVQRQVGGIGAADNRRDQTDAIALFAQDSMRFGRFTLTPGVRFEHLMQEYYDRNAGTAGSGTLDIWAGGVGFNYQPSKQLTVFGGAYRGFSVPDPRSAVRNGLTEESSIATELGTRWEPLPALQLELTLFYTHFDDLIVIDNVIGAGAMENAGSVHCGGVEWRLQYDPCAGRLGGLRTPLFAAVTFTEARLDGDASSSNPDSMFCGGKDGNDVPYIPHWQCVIGAGLHLRHCGGEVRFVYQSETYTTASNSTAPVNPVTGKPDARVGKTDEIITVDVSAYYQIHPQVRLIGSIQNLFDRECIVSRHPYGPRPNKPLTALIGMEIQF